MAKVLVLNASYEPLNITNWQRAIVLVIKGKAEQIEHNGKMIYPGMPLPTVIRMLQYISIPYKEIPLTRRNIPIVTLTLVSIVGIQAMTLPSIMSCRDRVVVLIVGTILLLLVCVVMSKRATARPRRQVCP